MKKIKYLALLRGVNVGGNNKIEMPKLKKTFEKLNLEHVSTYINSGNVMFETSDKDIANLTKKVESQIKQDFKLAIKVLLIKLESIKKICNGISKDWENNVDQRTDVLFLWEDYNKKSSLNLIKINSAVDNIAYIKGAIVWNVERKNISKSGMKKFIGTELYKNMTARNINTTRKLRELMSRF